MWFSAMAQLVVFVGARIEHYERSLFVFQADESAAAHRRAVELGRELEATYNNQHDDTVRWQLVRVETLDVLGDVLDGREVFSESAPYDGEPLPDVGPDAVSPGSAGISR
jgi:hypothetical protein